MIPTTPARLARLIAIELTLRAIPTPLCKVVIATIVFWALLLLMTVA